MKRFKMLILSMLILFICSPVMADITSHPNYAVIQSQKNTMIAVIAAKQAEYYTIHNKYFQGMSIPSTIVCNGSTFVPVDFGLHPDDQSDSWGSFLPQYFNIETRVLFNIRIDAIASEGKHGYLIVFNLVRDGISPDKYGGVGSRWVYFMAGGELQMEGVFNDWFTENLE